MATRNPKAAPPSSDLEPEKVEIATEDLPEIADDNGAADQNGAPVVTESVEELKEQLRLATSRAEQAEAEKRAAQAGQTQTANDLFNSHVQVIDNALAKEDGVKKDLRQRIVAAKEAGDYNAEADLTDQLQQTNLKISRLTEGKNELDRQKTMAEEQAKSTPADPVERYVQRLLPRAQQWVRSHPEVVTDAARKDDLEAAHFGALSKRLREGTDEYFAYIEQELGYAARPGARTDTIDPNPPPRRDTYVAPPSRQNNGNGSGADLPDGVTLGGDGKYRMNDTLRSFARDLGMSDAEYLKGLLDLKKEGRLSN